MSNNPKNLFEWAESQETPVPLPDKNTDDLFERCAQCEIYGGSCPTHPKIKTVHSVDAGLDREYDTYRKDWDSHHRVADREAHIAQVQKDADRQLSPDEISKEIKRWKEGLQ